jgi:hypothetical protein
MTRITFNTANPDLGIVRQVVFQRLRADRGWNQLDYDGSGFLPFVKLTPPRPRDNHEFAFMAMDVFWQLVIEGVLAPGANAPNPNLPFFHVTAHGNRVLDDNEYEPHDHTGYLARLRAKISIPDGTVFAYLDECLETFVRGNLVASMVMLGVAAERVFDLLCESLLPALTDPQEQAEFSRILGRFPMKPKVDWAHDKLRRVQDQRPRPAGFPENTGLMATAIYDMIRSQRNDLGHPRETPPRLGRGDAYANIQIFPRYYETAETVRRFLATTKV